MIGYLSLLDVELTTGYSTLPSKCVTLTQSNVHCAFSLPLRIFPARGVGFEAKIWAIQQTLGLDASACILEGIS